MKTIKNIKVLLIAALLLIISILIIFYDFILYGGCLLIATAVIHKIWNTWIRKKSKKVTELESENEGLKTKIEELNKQKSNVLGIKDILELGLKEFDTKLTRT